MAAIAIEEEVGCACMTLKVALDHAEGMSSEDPDYKSTRRRLLLHLRAFADKHPEVGLKEEHFGETEDGEEYISFDLIFRVPGKPPVRLKSMRGLTMGGTANGKPSLRNFAKTVAKMNVMAQKFALKKT
jgi:hypothetical protein